jgi:hypothetical protein
MKWGIRITIFLVLWLVIVLVRSAIGLALSPGFTRFLLTLVVAVLLTQVVLARREDEPGGKKPDEGLQQQLAQSEREVERLEREVERLQGLLSSTTAVKVMSITEEAGGRYAVLRNVLDEDRDLAGEIVVHESGARYMLPEDLSLRPGENVRLLARESIDEGDTLMLVEQLSTDTDEE